MHKTRRNCAIVGWMAFLMAIVAEGVFFSQFDPFDLALATGRDWDALGAYSIGFLCFWGSFTVAGLLAVKLTRPVPNHGRPRRLA